MKNLILKLQLVILFTCNLIFLSGQILDTLEYSDGNYMVIDRLERERMDKSEVRLIRGTYDVYNENGSLIKGSLFFENEYMSYEEIRDSSGLKSTCEEILEDNNWSQTTRIYYPSQKIEIEIISNKSFYEERSYYDNELNSLHVYQRREPSVPELFDSLKLRSEMGEGYLIEQNIVEEILMWKYYIEYHENGRVKATGAFSNRLYWEFRDKDYYEKYQSMSSEGVKFYREDGTMNVVVNRNPKVRHGKWLFFNTSGELIEEVDYVEGVK